jgi:hypothetical protein
VTYITPYMAPSLEHHVLTCLLDTDEVKVYRMARLDDSAYRVQLTFSPEGIAIQGDVGLGAAQNGICSRLGKGLGWFRGKLSEDYLCSKFMSKTWQHEAVGRDLQARLSDAEGEFKRAWDEAQAEQDDDDPLAPADLEEHKDAENWKALIADFGDETSEKELHTAGSALFTDFWDYGTGMDYPLADAGWLCAIQQRFAALVSDLDTSTRLQGEETE